MNLQYARLLFVVETTGDGSATVADWLTVALLFATALISLWGVVVARKTRTQAHRAVCVVTRGPTDPPAEGSTEHPVSVRELDDLHHNWYTVIGNQVPHAVAQKRYFRLTLVNDGQSRITGWEILGKAIVQPGDLAQKLPLREDSIVWRIAKTETDFHVPPGKSLTIRICNIEAFPKAMFSWTVKYHDSRGHFSDADFDDRQYTVENAFLILGKLPITRHPLVFDEPENGQ